MQARYYVDEVKDKSGKDIDVSSWEQEYVEDLPEQENGYTCYIRLDLHFFSESPQENLITIIFLSNDLCVHVCR